MSGVKGQLRLNHRPCVRDRLWTTMRIMRHFSSPDLIACAEAGIDNTRRYLNGLVRAGIVQLVIPKANGHKGGHAYYRLSRDLGPKAPLLRADRSLYDPNRGGVVGGGL